MKTTNNYQMSVSHEEPTTHYRQTIEPQDGGSEMNSSKKKLSERVPAGQRAQEGTETNSGYPPTLGFQAETAINFGDDFAHGQHVLIDGDPSSDAERRSYQDDRSARWQDLNEALADALRARDWLLADRLRESVNRIGSAIEIGGVR